MVNEERENSIDHQKKNMNEACAVRHQALMKMNWVVSEFKFFSARNGGSYIYIKSQHVPNKHIIPSN